jgi:tRNA(Phe) wybutosine-synthesizing methylase Tyw3
MGIVKAAGFKRCGLINFKKRIILEIMSTEMVETPVIMGGKVIAGDSYIAEVVEAANRNMEKNTERMKALSRKLEC